ncbi:sel1 repeat family protein, partial [Streptomyces sp. SID8455]|nr:sel1 repeat family protein [Streptomyces sp. SID8455]
QAGDHTGAEPWFSKAAEAGSVDAAFNLGILHAGRDEDRTALGWYQRAAAAGHTDAALQVAMALLRDGEDREAERHLRCA